MTASVPGIAITGVGVMSAIGAGREEFAQGLRAARCGIGEVQELDTSWATTTLGGEVRDFDPPGLDGVELARVDALALAAAIEAVEHADLADADRRSGVRIGVSVGTCQSAVAELAKFDRGLASDVRLVSSPADAIALRFGLRGPRLVASNACAAGGAAITLARDELLRGGADVMLAGGSDELAFFTYACFSVLQALDDEPCSPYGRSSGLTLGEGAAIFVLETLEHATARGVEPIAVLAGCGASADGHHPTAPDPTGRGAALAMQRALREAGLDPDAVDYVNGHGTGTPTNDTMERAAFRLVFGERTREVPFSSTKSQIGHTLGAAGAIEAAASVLALRDGFLPPTVNVPEGLEPDHDVVANVARSADLDVVVSNNYAFGGSNASLVLVRPGREQPASPRAEQRVLVTGVGAVGALGEGVDAWFDAFDAGRTGVRRVEGFESEAAASALGAQAVELAGRKYAARNDWRKMDSFSRLCVAATRQAWLDAALTPSRAELDDVALVFATATGAISDIVAFDRASRAGREHVNPSLVPNIALNAAAGHVCTTLRIHGPMLSVTEGGLSSWVGLQHAAELVRRGEVSTAIVLAGDELCEAAFEAAASSAPELLTHSAVRPFDLRADGTAFGTAAVALVLESEEHATVREARPLAAVLGGAMVGSLEPGGAPDPADWVEAMELALERSEVDAGQVGYCAAAANGTPDADAAELAALAKVFGAGIAVGAPKSMTGECLGSTAAINALAGVHALAGGRLAPTVGLEQPVDVPEVRHVTGAAIDAHVDHVVVDAGLAGIACASLVLGRP